MSGKMERNKGKLIPTGKTTDGFTDDDRDDSDLVEINGMIYSVEWEVKGRTDGDEFADVVCNDDGTIDFHTYHYNGGAYWTEVVQWELNK